MIFRKKKIRASSVNSKNQLKVMTTKKTMEVELLSWVQVVKNATN